jgi:hypothetical protein
MTARLRSFRRNATPDPRPAAGTLFRLFPVYAEGLPPETIAVPLPPGSIGAGPSDAQLYVADAAGKSAPYDPPGYSPPYGGKLLPPALPDAAGNFDHIPVDTPQFLAAHLYGSVRHTLDVWQHYLGRRITWWHADAYPRMELIPLIDWENAQSGPGFIETGIWHGPDGTAQPFALNFDVVAHETGHQMLFSLIGVPDEDAIGVPFLAFHESFSDLVALIAVMHFPSVIGQLLAETEGNLYLDNLVNRFAETSAHTQIRMAANLDVMADVAGIALAQDGSWIDPDGLGRNQHAVAAPLTGAIFDILVEVYQDRLVSEGLLPADSDARGWTRAEVEAAFDDLHGATAVAYRRFAGGFTDAVLHARDTVGVALAHVMLSVRPAGLTFGQVAARFLESMLAQGHAPMLPAMLDHFLWRGIDPLPHLALRPAGGAGRARFAVAPARRRDRCPFCHPSATLRAIRLIREGHRVGAAQ